MHLLLFTKQTCMLWNGYEHESDSNITRTSNAIANKSPSTAMYEGETPFRLSIIFSARTYLKDPTMSRYIFRTGCQFFKLNKLTTTWHGCRGEVNHVTLQINGYQMSHQYYDHPSTPPPPMRTSDLPTLLWWWWKYVMT